MCENFNEDNDKQNKSDGIKKDRRLFFNIIFFLFNDIHPLFYMNQLEQIMNSEYFNSHFLLITMYRCAHLSIYSRNCMIR